MPILDDLSITIEDCVVLVNYYGQLDDYKIRNIAEKFNVFLDNTQDFFNKPKFNIDAANSCRKFFGVSGGSYLYTDLSAKELNEYEYDTAVERITSAIGRFETNANNFYNIFLRNEEFVRGIPIKRMSKFDRNILRSLNYKEIIAIRRVNYEYLDKIFRDYNLLKLKNNAGLFMYPLLIDNGRDVKLKLIEEKIYVPTLWPGVLDFNNLTQFERNLVDNLVLLPIDQRYDIEDMEYIVKVVMKYIM